MDNDLEKLFGIWLSEDEAGEVTLARLLDRLRNDASFRENFVSELTMLGKLRAVHSAEPRWLKLNDRLGEFSYDGTDDEAFEAGVMERFEQYAIEESSRSSKTLWRWAGLVFGVVLGAVLLWTGQALFRSLESEKIFSEERNDGPINEDSGEQIGLVAMLSRTAGAEWSGDEELARGTNFLPRKLVLEAGLAQIDFYGGAHLIVQGPAEIEIASSREVSLKSGVATCYVSELGQGFRVITPEGEIFDQGTAFAVSTGDSVATEVHVLEGAVSILGKSLPSRTASEIHEGRFTPIPFKPDRFPRANEFILRAQEYDVGRLQHWWEEAAKLSADPDVKLHYTMEGRDQLDFEVINHAKANSPGRASNGTILGTTLTEGRWKGKSAIQFSNEDDRLLARLPGAYPEVTFLIWARIDALTQPYTSLILAERPERWFLNGSVPEDDLEEAIKRRSESLTKITRWTAFKETGALQFSVAFRPESSLPFTWQTHRSQPDLVSTKSWGNWGCYAVTYDSAQRRVVHYHNGEQVGISAIDQPEPLIIDYLEIGNLSTHRNEVEKGVQYRFYGVMDEILIATRAFKPAEMKRIYEYGKP